MPGQHAICNPSSAKMWLTCTKSVRAAAHIPEKSSVYADEGTIAHKLGETYILWRLRRITEKVYKKALIDIKKSFDELQAANPDVKMSYALMQDYADEYASYVISRYNAVRKVHPSACILIEVRVDMSPWIPEGFGTADVIIMAPEYLEFIDLKYGAGVAVYAQENPQLMMYALGVDNDFGFIWNFVDCILTIYQPRIDNISHFVTDFNHILAWGENVVKPQAQKAFRGEGEFVAGDHCQFCKLKPICRANAQYRLNMSGAFKLPDELTDDEIVEVLEKYEGLVNWAGSVEDYALQKALAGKKWPGYKLIAARSNRVFTDKQAVVKVLLKAGYKPKDFMTEPALKSLGELESELGKKDFSYHLNKLVNKPYGKPALAPESDPKSEYDRSKEANNIFAHVINNSSI